jgi:hypothetical protein
MLETIKAYALQIKIILGVAAVLAVTFFINDYIDAKNELKRQVAMTSTLQSDFKKVGEAYQSTNEILKKNSEAQTEATKLLGNQMVQYMNANNAQLQSLFTTVGKINANMMDLTKIIGGSRDATGVVKDVKLVQERPNAPALTSLNLNYDPSKPLGLAFTGSKWKNNKELFTTSFGEWKLEDGGYRSAAKMSREVYDENNVLIGKEEIPLESAKNMFTPSAFGLDKALPRFTVSPVAGYNFDTKKWTAGILGGYRVNNKMELTAGFIGTTSVIGLGYKFDIKP